MPRVLIVYNEPTLPADHPDADSEHDILYTADTVAKILQQAHLTVLRLGIVDDPAVLIAGIRAANADVIFNLYEGTAKWGNAEAYVSGIYELLRIPYTGCPTQPLLMCRSKPLTKKLLAGAGLPTARFLSVEDGPIPTCDIPWPVIVKPGTEDASVGIDQASVVTSQEQLEARVHYLRERYGPSVLIEQFVRGREFNVALIQRNGVLDTLPFSEILFVPPDDQPDLWPIVSFDAKWRPGTRDFVATPAKNPAENVSPELHAAVASVAKKAFELTGCRDYARVDFRVDETGRPYVLEVNPNPCISPLAGLAAGLETAKIPYSEFILDLVREALRRGPTPDLADAVQSIDESAPAPAPLPSNERAETRRRGPTVRVRPMRRSDSTRLPDLFQSADGWTDDEQRRQVETCGKLLARKNRDGWLGFALATRDEVFGAASLRPHDTTQGTFLLDWLVVDSLKRRTGLGRELLTQVEEAVATAGGRMLLVHLSSGPGAAPLRQFLLRSGFTQAGEVPDYYRDGYARLSVVKSIASRNAVPALEEPTSKPAVNPIAG